MNEIIHIAVRRIGEQPDVSTVNARDLHAFLAVGKDFSTWIKDRIGQFGFVAGQDFTTTDGSPDSGNQTGRGGDRRSIDYHLSIDMAKELSMVERNEKGRQARRYFIECERRALGQVRPALAANDNIVLAETISRTLNLQGSAHLGLIRRAVEKFAPEHVDLLPGYAVDAPGDSGVSSEATAALTELLAEHDIRRSTQSVNKLIEEAGLLETLERKSSKCAEMRKFKSVTVAGRRFGKNVVSDRNPRETQPHWYRSTFIELLAEIGLAKRAA